VVAADWDAVEREAVAVAPYRKESHAMGARTRAMRSVSRPAAMRRTYPFVCV
jgi:hypothetical protein